MGRLDETRGLVAGDAKAATSEERLAYRAEVDRLGDEIAELAAHMHAATYRLLVRLREFDRRGGWGPGFRSCAHWLSWRTGMDPGASREKVRVARALEKLPVLSEELRHGRLSYAVVRALTRVATPENEAALRDVARHGTASQVERIVRAWRRVDRLEEQAIERWQYESRSLCMYTDEDGMVVVRGRLPAEAGAVLERALEIAQAQLHRPAPTPGEAALPAPVPTTAPQRRADALCMVAEIALRGFADPAAVAGARTEGAWVHPVAHEGSPSAGAVEGARQDREATELMMARSQPALPLRRSDRFQVVLHVDAEALHANSVTGQSVLETGAHVSAETSRRLACDASRVVMMHDATGSLLSVGRRTRTVPPAIRRALEHRDTGCRFPGCGSRFCDAHHIRHWADGGETRLTNLVRLCPHHHRAVHEGHFAVRADENGRLEFRRPSGEPVPESPASPRLPDPPVRHLQDQHAAIGVEIDAWTATPAWHGEKLDLGYAILALRRP